ncbi:hypothetical protein L4174_023835 (plasmid) [Photobacterium sp. CCB-ST2H9]|uniref:hypothetical protein n=1 Tax=Photobacterium sp. CCB-ST2H9 TaxID=2912855 RepID=UPI002002AFF3|nr:hypothetical protein [Photobacterium sp. CCB-ST2H9]UTM60418.1 hypothetical protein L4174_023835 [Photobacterium sp. CCB-ST2H9]
MIQVHIFNPTGMTVHVLGIAIQPYSECPKGQDIDMALEDFANFKSQVQTVAKNIIIKAAKSQAETEKPSDTTLNNDQGEDAEGDKPSSTNAGKTGRGRKPTNASTEDK